MVTLRCVGSAPDTTDSRRPRGRTESRAPRGPDGRAPRVTLERTRYDPAEWSAIVASCEDAEVYHTAAWLEFLAVTQHAEPVVAIVRADGRPVGHFVGAIVRRYGVRILGSPLRGWTTQCMGFLLEEGSCRRAAAEALIPFAFRDLGCLHVELADRKLTADQMRGSAYQMEAGRTFVVDLKPPEEALLSRFHRTARKEIRRAIHDGLWTEVATDAAFVDEFYGYLSAVFARQGLAPTYGIDRVRGLIQVLQPSGQLLLLRVRSPDGASLGAFLSVGRSQTAIAWGAAFDRNNRYHAIELLFWETMRRWRERGASSFDMGGSGDYKSKYGGVETPTVHFYRSRWAILRFGRTAIRHSARVRQVIAGARRRPLANGGDRVGDG
jgi:CelD/BcsL family acetyltransferase involved in cellulose biosynthesis